ncbi:hypothetical protein P0136_02145 [Lentisphaerota bacterium ZTH]|nr:hypothetical protein JYG24_06715 [Lentisphaerota bacterium]WET06807.1 hypothetical protein P0136_02145 [Lentisphaerota bacterium ZTH]
MEIFFIGAATLIVLLLLLILLSGFFMYIGARMAMVPGATFLKAVGVAVAVNVLCSLLAFFLAFIPAVGPIAGGIIGNIFAVFLIKSFFEIGWGKALLVLIFNIFAQVIVTILGILLLAGTFAATA